MNCKLLDLRPYLQRMDYKLSTLNCPNALLPELTPKLENI
jgi:hypothetical protein